MQKERKLHEATSRAQDVLTLATKRRSVLVERKEVEEEPAPKARAAASKDHSRRSREFESRWQYIDIL